MDSFQPQAGGLHLPGGHEEGDFNVKGIVLFAIILVASAVFTFIAAWVLMNFLERFEKAEFDKPATPVQQQLSQQRGEMVSKEGASRPQPDWYNRAVDEKAMEKTFATPRLQYDDESDMGAFLKSEQDWLSSTGRNSDGSVHIPVSRAMDLVSKGGLPSVNGTFAPQPPLGGLEAVAEAARRRVGEVNAPSQPKETRKK